MIPYTAAMVSSALNANVGQEIIQRSSAILDANSYATRT